MTDILDNLDDIEDETGDEVILADDAEDAELIELDDLEDMDVAEAEEITAAIRSTITATYVLLRRAHEGKAYKALGYETWKEYIAGEFDFSVQRSYQLLDLAKTVEVIESATPEGTDVSLTEAQARDIKRELPKITEQVREETAGSDPIEASEIVDNIVDDAREQQKADEKTLAQKEKEKADRELEAERAELESQADALLEPDADSNLTDSASGDYVDFDVAGDGSEVSQRDAMALYNFFNFLTTYESLPEPSEMLKLIPEERAEEVEKSLLSITGWFNNFHTLWEERDSE